MSPTCSLTPDASDANECEEVLDAIADVATGVVSAYKEEDEARYNQLTSHTCDSAPDPVDAYPGFPVFVDYMKGVSSTTLLGTFLLPGTALPLWNIKEAERSMYSPIMPLASANDEVLHCEALVGDPLVYFLMTLAGDMDSFDMKPASRGADDEKVVTIAIGESSKDCRYPPPQLELVELINGPTTRRAPIVQFIDATFTLLERYVRKDADPDELVEAFRKRFSPESQSRLKRALLDDLAEDTVRTVIENAYALPKTVRRVFVLAEDVYLALLDSGSSAPKSRKFIFIRGTDDSFEIINWNKTTPLSSLLNSVPLKQSS